MNRSFKNLVKYKIGLKAALFGIVGAILGSVGLSLIDNIAKKREKYIIPQYSSDWAAWGTWIGAIGALVTVIYAVTQFQELLKEKKLRQLHKALSLKSKLTRYLGGLGSEETPKNGRMFIVFRWEGGEPIDNLWLKITLAPDQKSKIKIFSYFLEGEIDEPPYRTTTSSSEHIWETSNQVFRMGRMYPDSYCRVTVPIPDMETKAEMFKSLSKSNYYPRYEHEGKHELITLTFTDSEGYEYQMWPVSGIVELL